MEELTRRTLVVATGGGIGDCLCRFLGCAALAARRGWGVYVAPGNVLASLFPGLDRVGEAPVVWSEQHPMDPARVIEVPLDKDDPAHRDMRFEVPEGSGTRWLRLRGELHFTGYSSCAWMPREYVRDVLARDLLPRVPGPVLDFVHDFAREHMDGGPVLGVHVRHGGGEAELYARSTRSRHDRERSRWTSPGRGTLSHDAAETARTLWDAIEARGDLCRPHAPVLVCSDSYGIVEAFRELLGRHRVLCAGEGSEIRERIRGDRLRMSEAQVRFAFQEMLLLARCEALVWTNGIFTTPVAQAHVPPSRQLQWNGRILRRRSSYD